MLFACTVRVHVGAGRALAHTAPAPSCAAHYYLSPVGWPGRAGRSHGQIIDHPPSVPDHRSATLDHPTIRPQSRPRGAAQAREPALLDASLLAARLGRDAWANASAPMEGISSATSVPPAAPAPRAPQARACPQPRIAVVPGARHSAAARNQFVLSAGVLSCLLFCRRVVLSGGKQVGGRWQSGLSLTRSPGCSTAHRPPQVVRAPAPPRGTRRARRRTARGPPA